MAPLEKDPPPPRRRVSLPCPSSVASSLPPESSRSSSLRKGKIRRGGRRRRAPEDDEDEDYDDDYDDDGTGRCDDDDDSSSNNNNDSSSSNNNNDSSIRSRSNGRISDSRSSSSSGGSSSQNKGTDNACGMPPPSTASGRSASHLTRRSRQPRQRQRRYSCGRRLLSLLLLHSLGRSALAILPGLLVQRRRRLLSLLRGAAAVVVAFVLAIAGAQTKAGGGSGVAFVGVAALVRPACAYQYQHAHPNRHGPCRAAEPHPSGPSSPGGCRACPRPGGGTAVATSPLGQRPFRLTSAPLRTLHASPLDGSDEAPLPPTRPAAAAWVGSASTWKGAIATTPTADPVRRFALEQQGAIWLADTIRTRLQERQSMSAASPSNKLSAAAAAGSSSLEDLPEAVKGRFMDLTTHAEGERVLESLFCPSRAVSDNDSGNDDDDNNNNNNNGSTTNDSTKKDLIDGASHPVAPDVLMAAVEALQSLCVMGTCVGLKGPPEQLRRLVAHLDSRNDPQWLDRDRHVWDNDSVRRLKYQAILDPDATRAPAMNLLSALKWKRTPAGAFDLLVRLGAWTVHEDLALLRSGFPLRFTESELAEAQRVAKAATSDVTTAGPPNDPDSLLGIRRDFRHMKVYTVDSASTSEIDDGVSVEMVRNETAGSDRPRYWIHIADADRWTSPQLREVARKRITSLYIPTGSYPMFPPPVSTELMSLRANHDASALSLGVHLNEDGSIDASSLIVTPSVIRVTYRLTYDEVDEMLEEGAGYSEEWQLGMLLDGALKRRDFRMRAGSTESLVPNPIPSASVSVYPDRAAPDGIGISLSVQVSHNAGKNQTSSAADSLSSGSIAAPVSSAYLLVTELMILAGEAIAQWKSCEDQLAATRPRINGDTDPSPMPNQIRLPFRTQPPPGTFVQLSVGPM
jgi:RNB domain